MSPLPLSDAASRKDTNKKAKAQKAREYARCPGCGARIEVHANKAPDDEIEDHARHCPAVHNRPDLIEFRQRLTSHAQPDHYPPSRRR